MAPSTSHRRTGSPIVVAFAVVLSALTALPFVGRASAAPASAAPAAWAALATSAGPAAAMHPSAALASASNLETEQTPEGGTEGDVTDPDGEAGAGETGSTDSTQPLSTVAPGASAENESSIVENPLVVAEDDQKGSSAAEDRKIWAVIGGLLLVALALTVLTVRYWRNTRPTGTKPSSSGRAKGRSSSGGGAKRARSADEPAPHEELGSDDLFVDEP